MSGPTASADVAAASGTGNQKTIEAKRALGNPGKRPLAAPRVLTTATRDDTPIVPPRPLATPGRTIFNRVIAHATWLDLNNDIEMLLRVCEQADEHAALRYKVLNDQDNYRARTQLRAIDAQIMAGLAALGLSPIDRARMGVAELVKADPLDELRRQRRAQVPRPTRPNPTRPEIS